MRCERMCCNCGPHFKPVKPLPQDVDEYMFARKFRRLADYLYSLPSDVGQVAALELRCAASDLCPCQYSEAGICWNHGPRPEADKCRVGHILVDTM